MPPDPREKPSPLREIVELLEKNFQDSDRAEKHLSALGFTEPSKVYQNLRLLREGGEEAFAGILPILIEGLPGVPDPAMALNNFERFAASDDEGKVGLYRFLHSHPEALTRLLFLFGASHSLARFLRNAPRDAAATLARPDLLRHRKDRVRLDSELTVLLGPSPSLEEAKVGLRHFRQREYVRIVLRDLLGQGDVSEITAEISDLSDACLQAAVAVCDRELRRRYGAPMFTDPDGKIFPCRYTVFGMGKLGGGELNYSSDIDLIFLYSSDNGETTGIPENGEEAGLRAGQKISNHEYYVKLSELLTRIIGETTSDGVVFRVDTRLRPEGEKGDLACSLRSYEIYYESWGQTWERAALLKARPVAGDEALGRAFLQTVHPFVYRKYLDFRAIEEIRDMKRRINQSVALKGREMKDVKLGYGGIREVEFFVQAL
ncbi:MAG: hypothetical protein HY760_02120 [Nitrospirae bacterium]|nr:hypothetical protein [Nitrospirota bacterium]